MGKQENKEKIPYRQIHLDFHTSPYIDGIAEKFDSKEFINTLKKAHVNSINLFTKCHHGMFYYPTKIGTIHPNLNIDLFGEQIKACRENEIRAIAYTCVAWNEDWADRHPEWLVVDYDGVLGHKLPFDASYNSWRSLCINNHDYKELLKAEFKEVYDLYHPDGYWIDIVLGKDCICDECSRDMKLLGLNPEDYQDVKKFNTIAEINFCREFYEYLSGLDENLEIYFNSHPYELDDGQNKDCTSIEKRKYFDFIDIESLPSEQWGYTHFPIAANYVNKYDKEICMMNGKFHTSWGDFGSIRHKNAMEYECFRALAYGAKICMGDQLHPSGALDQTIYDRIGEVFAEVEKVEPWLAGSRKVCEVAVFITIQAGKGNPDEGGLIEEGVYRVLSELHIPFDFVNCEDDLSVYKLLILPDEVMAGHEMAGKIDAYVKAGGKILVTGSSCVTDGKFQIESVCAEYIGHSEFDARYIRFDEAHFHDIPRMDHVIYCAGENVKAKGETVAFVVEPYFARTYKHFCSHRQTPPRLETSGEPAIVKNENCVYVTFPLFKAYACYGYTVYRDILSSCIDLLYTDRYIITDLPGITELTLRRQEHKYLLHMLNYVVQKKAKQLSTVEDKYVVQDSFIKLRTPFEPSAVMEVRNNKIINFSYADGYTTIMVDKEMGYTLYSIE